MSLIIRVSVNMACDFPRHPYINLDKLIISRSRKALPWTTVIGSLLLRSPFFHLEASSLGVYNSQSTVILIQYGDMPVR